VRISVIVPFQNEELHFARCLSALSAQEPFDGEDEILAVASGSSDRSCDIAADFPNVRVVVADRPGPYAARNTGVAATTGDVVAFTDGDCEAAPNWLRRIASAFRDASTHVVVGSRLTARDSFLLSLVDAYELAKDQYVFQARRRELYYASATNLAVRRTSFAELGGFVERRRGADTLLIRTAADRWSPAAVKYEPELRVRHLEIATLRDYYGKCLSYGRSMAALRASGRSLRSRERLSVWRRAVSSEGYAAPLAAAQLVALGGGAICWAIGSATARFARNGSRQ
jgi:glycosyltransferase involved in cell wall biosynthesis